mmetsp:Transcript_19764/g.47334  ORF Transcript_19764/g.47334 Transcript_19764/m.47334 type:complete len:134 (-) Transcript_19764:274-675(-)
MACLSFAVRWVLLSPEVGGCVALFTVAQAGIASAIVGREVKAGAKGVAASRYGTAAKIAGVFHILSWYMQIHPGHLVFEGRRPALLDSLTQAFMDAPLFVWFEVAFKLGYRPELQQALTVAVQRQHLVWASGA